MPLYGHELTEQITPFDASLGAGVKLDKPEFVGRSALEERAARGNGPGTLQLVALAGEGRRAARAGCTVTDAEGTSLGTITSGLLSPTLGHPIALALVGPSPDPQAPVWEPGAELVVDVRGKAYPMRVVAAPFYKRQR